MNPSRLLLAFFFAAPFISAAPAAEPPKTQTFQVEGLVTKLDAGGTNVTIRHKEIPNYMAAMTMEFHVRDPKDLTGIAAGDRVEFRLLVTEDESWIEALKSLGKAPLPAPNPKPEGLRPTVSPLRVGDPLPDMVLTNQDGRAISFAQFRGQALAFTFIFTRCPLPDYCPRMSTRFLSASQELATRAGAPTNWHLISISFDPEFDKPVVLKGYASNYQRDSSRWDFATGDPAALDRLQQSCGLLARPDAGTFSHNLRTVVANSQGIVTHIFIGNGWSADDLLKELEKAAR